MVTAHGAVIQDHGPADFVVEVLSPESRGRDTVDKLREYSECGVKEYWIIDRFERTMTVFRPAEKKPEQQIVGENDVYRTPLLPDFELPLSRLLRVADDWKES